MNRRLSSMRQATLKLILPKRNLGQPGEVMSSDRPNGASLCRHSRASYPYLDRLCVRWAKTTAYSEADPPCPINVYELTKLAGEQAIQNCLTQHVILRTAWAYGEFGHNFLKTIVRLASSRDELRIVADQQGNPTSTRQLADAILRIVPRLVHAEQPWGTYHFSGSGVTNWHEFARRIVAAQAPLTGRKPVVNAITSADYSTAVPRPANSTLDCARFAQVFGFRAGPWAEETDAVTRAVVLSGEITSHVA